MEKCPEVSLVHILSDKEKVYRIKKIIVFQGTVWLQGISPDLKKRKSHPHASILV